MDPHKALESLLLSLFSAEELRRFMRYLPAGDLLVQALPGPHASPMVVAHEAVAALASDGRLVDGDLWARMAEERPRRKPEIDKVRALFSEPAPSAALPSTTAPTSDILTIVLASASPAHDVRLRVDQEFRQINEKLRGSRHRDRLRIIQVPAVRFEDLRTALMEHEPDILHLSCHGEPDGSLRFESTDTGAQIVPKKNFIKLLRALGNNLRLVVINACHSAELARDIPPTVPVSVGMSDSILDRDAIDFAVAFYEALAFGKPVRTAFDAALAGLDEEGDQIPQFFTTDALPR